MKWMIVCAILMTLAGGSQANPLTEGDRIPDVSVTDQNGNAVRLAELSGKWVILYFYPKDDTPGCRREAETFSRLKPQFDELGAVIFGVSTDDAASHRKFIQKRNLTIDLLVDPDRVLMKLFEVKVRFGFCSRDTVLVNPDGTVEKIYRGVSPEGNPEEILHYLKSKTAGR